MCKSSREDFSFKGIFFKRRLGLGIIRPSFIRAPPSKSKDEYNNWIQFSKAAQFYLQICVH